jgi:hypothetical protein
MSIFTTLDTVLEVLATAIKQGGKRHIDWK